MNIYENNTAKWRFHCRYRDLVNNAYVWKPVPLNEATSLKVFIKQPDGTVYEDDATVFTNGTDGIMLYVAPAGTLTPTGDWEIQPYMETPTEHWHGEPYVFHVLAPLVVTPPEP